MGRWLLPILLITACAGSVRDNDLRPGDAGPRADAAADLGVGVDATPGVDAAPGVDATPGQDAEADAGTPQDVGTGGDSGVVDTGEVVMLPTGTPAADEIRINETVRYQTLDGVGANTYPYAYASDIGWDWNQVRYVYDEVNLHYIRAAVWFGWWETTNDNADPQTINWNGFMTVNRIAEYHDLPFDQWLAGRGIPSALGVWDHGDWLASGSPRRVASSLYDELGESIAAYLLYKEMNGLPQTYTEVQNEPGIEAAVNYASPEDLRDAAKATLDAFDHFGLQHVMLHGPNFHQPSGAADWARVWLADQRLRDRTVAVSYHTWWNDDFQSYDAIRQVAEQYGKPVWATELGYCALESGCFGGTHFLRPTTWATAWDYAMSYYRAIAWSRASRVYHWALMGSDPVVGPDGARTPSLSILKQFANYIDPGARFLDSASGQTEVLVLPFLLSNGDRAVILLNTGNTERPMKITSVAGQSLSVLEGLSSRQGNLEQTPTTSGPNGTGQVEVRLPAQSVVSLRIRGQ